MKSYTVLLAVGIGVIGIIATVVGIDIARVTVATQEYALYVDPIIDRQNLFTTARVTVQNTGSEDLSGVRVIFGGGDHMLIGDLKAGQKMIVSPPPENAMRIVMVTSNEGVHITSEYREPPKMFGMMGS